jgi:hypothetical protein
MGGYKGSSSVHSAADGIGDPITVGGRESTPEATIHSPAGDLAGKGFSDSPSQAEFGSMYGISSPGRASTDGLGEMVQLVTGLPSSPASNTGSTGMADGLAKSPKG